MVAQTRMAWMLVIATQAWRASGAVRAPLARSRMLAGVRTLPGVASHSQCAASMAATVPAVKSIAHLGTHEEHPAFELLRVDTVDEYGALCGVYRHKLTGAEVLSVIADEPNKVFGITFRTPPSDSTGVPHILEHSVLCGSRNYPTKDPFVELLKGSLQTFLNAFTYPDRTCYPVASMNLKDFYNLVNVYLDAVLHPRAVNDPLVLQQEGWHLELDDPSQPLTYKGVVYNEMKGVYSSPDSLLMRRTQQELFPDNTYGVDSGGTPSIIPQLSFDMFRSFHGQFYHPTNARASPRAGGGARSRDGVLARAGRGEREGAHFGMRRFPLSARRCARALARAPIVVVLCV